MCKEFKLFQLCCEHIKVLLKKVYGYTDIHIKSFSLTETDGGLNNHLKVKYILFKDAIITHSSDVFNSRKLKRYHIPEGIFSEYNKKLNAEKGKDEA